MENYFENLGAPLSWKQYFKDINVPISWEQGCIQGLKTNKEYFMRFICGIMERVDKIEDDDERNTLMYGEIAGLYKSIEKQKDDTSLKDYWERVKVITQVMWEIDIGISLEMKTEIKPLERNISKEEHDKRLAILDKALCLFKGYIENAFKKTDHICDKNIIIYWGRHFYYKVYGFQAPARSDPALALKDSMGLTDHYIEMIEDIVKVKIN